MCGAAAARIAAFRASNDPPLLTQGFSIDPCLHAGGPAGRSLVPNSDLPPGTCALTVPPRWLLTGDELGADPDYGDAWAVVESGLGAGAADGPVGDRDALVLALLAAAARGPASRWAPYVASLPSTYDDPTWWSAEHRALLAGSRAGAAAAAADAALARLGRLRDRLVAAAGGDGGPLVTARHGWGASEAGVRWARSTVWSRAFNLPGPSPPPNPNPDHYPNPRPPPRVALVPVVDMLDHDPGVAVAWTAGGDGRGEFCWTLGSPCAAGTPLATNYSPQKSNEELLAGYGFVLPRNAADFFHFSVGVGGAGRAAAARRALVRALAVPRDAYCRAAAPLPTAALAAAAVALADGAEAARLGEAAVAGVGPAAAAPPGRRGGDLPAVTIRPAPPAPCAPPPGIDWGLPVAPATAVAALAALRASLAARAAALGPRRAADDAADAARSSTPPHAAMALAYRARQKELAAAAGDALAVTAAAVLAALAAAAAKVGPGGAPEPVSEGVTALPGVGETDAGSWAWGLAVAAGAARGAVLARVPEAAAWVVTGDESDLEDALARWAVGEGGRPAAVAALLAAFPPPPTSTLLLDGHPAALLLRNTPAGDELHAQAAAALDEAGGDRGAARARAWAGAATARAALPGPEPGTACIAPLASAIPPALRGVATTAAWEGLDGARVLVVRAAADLPPAARLAPPMTAIGGVAHEILLEHGPEAVAAVAAAADLLRELGGPAPLRHAFPLEPPTPCCSAAKAMLKAACLDSEMWVAGAAGATAAAVAAAVAAARRPALDAAGAKAAIKAVKAATTAEEAAAAAGGSGRDDAEQEGRAAAAAAAASAAAVAATPAGAAAKAELRRRLLDLAAAWEVEGGGGDSSVIAAGARLHRSGLARAAAAAAKAVAGRAREGEGM